MGGFGMTAFPDIRPTSRPERPRCSYEIDCDGARLYAHTRSIATVLRLEGEIDTSNAYLVAQAIRRVLNLQAPLILDLSQLEFLGIAGFRALLILNEEQQNAQLHYSVVAGHSTRRLMGVFTDHGLLVVDSVATGLQLIEDPGS